MEAYARLKEDARKCRVLFLEAGMGVPPLLSSFLGESQRERKSFWVRPVAPTGRPSEATDGWIWVPKDEILLYELVLAMLRKEGRRVSTGEICDAVQAERPATVVGSILNIGPRFEKTGVIDRNDEGWMLRKGDAALLLSGSHAWGPHERFDKQSVAWFRRMLIEDLIGKTPGGLQTSQVISHLKEADFIVGPRPTKELVSDDLEAMEKGGRIKRTSGHGKKWVLANAKGGVS